MIISNLAVLMAERGYRLNDVHMGANVSKTAIAGLVDNKSGGVQFETLNKLCVFFGVTPSELLLYTPNKWEFEILYTDGNEMFPQGIVSVFKDKKMYNKSLYFKFKWNRTNIMGTLSIIKNESYTNDSDTNYYMEVDFGSINEEIINEISKLNKLFLNEIRKELENKISDFLKEDGINKELNILTLSPILPFASVKIKVLNNPTCPLKNILPLNSVIIIE